MMWLARIGVVLVVLAACERFGTSSTTARSPDPPAVPAPKTDVFASSVRPILVQRCAPCHEPGGKLYAKLPFDDASVVAAHSTGVLKRIQDPIDHAAIEKWLASLEKK